MEHSRRNFLRNTSFAISGLPLSALLHPVADKMQTRRIVCVGGHPDDPESGCGGTLARLSAAGHEVSIIYLTTGEAGIPGKSATEAAAIRKQEALAACRVLNARPVFAGQIDGNTLFDNEWRSRMQQLISKETPDIVFTHWPIDSHQDHQVASLLTIQAWMHASPKFSLYFYEVCGGEQTMVFHPAEYVDITETQGQKRKAVFCHTSQDPDSIYACGHAAMEDFRGREMGVRAAEAFTKMTGRGTGGLQLF